MTQLGSGMDPAEARAIGLKLKTAGNQARCLVNDIQRLNDQIGCAWKGPDSSKFESTWVQLRPEVINLSIDLEERAKLVLENAAEQEAASGGGATFCSETGSTETPSMLDRFIDGVNKSNEYISSRLHPLGLVVDGIAEYGRRVFEGKALDNTTLNLARFGGFFTGLTGGWKLTDDLATTGGRNAFEIIGSSSLGLIGGLAGAKAGMLIGAAVGGPIGAAVGLVAGGLVGDFAGKNFGGAVGSVMDGALRGHGVESLKGVATEAVSTVTDAVSTAADNVRSALEQIKAPKLSLPF